MNQASLWREVLKEFPTPELAWFNHSGGGTGTESRSLAGSVSKRQMGMRDKPYCFFSAVTLSPDTRSPMGVRIHWYHQLSYFFSPLDDIRLERETGWNHSYTPHGEWSRSSLLFQNVIESLQTKLAWGKTVSTTRKLKYSPRAWLMPWGLNFSSSLYFQHGGFNLWLFMEAFGTLGSHTPRLKSHRKEDVFLFWKSHQKDYCISVTLIGS